MFKLNTIARKLPLTILVSALLVSAGVGVGSYVVSSQVVGELSRNNLMTVAHERAKEVQDFILSIRNDLHTTANSQSTVQAARDFGNAWVQVSGDKQATLQKAYIEDNPNPLGQRQLLDGGPADLNYSVSHARYNRGFSNQVATHGYSDLYIMDRAGNVVYSVTKQDDFAGNLTDPASPLANTALATVYKAAIAEDQPDAAAAFADFAPYAAQQNTDAAFLAEPIFNPLGGIQGVIAFQISPKLLDSVIGDRTGLGTSGEVTVVGADHLLRTDSIFTPDSDVLKATLPGSEVDAALGGKAESGVISGYRDTEMLIAAEPIAAAGVPWAVAAVMSTAEAYGPIAQLRNTMLVVGLALLALATIGGYLFSRSITRPVSRLTRAMKGLAAGDLEVGVEGAGRGDEIGEMARAVEVFRENAARVRVLTEEERAGSEHRRVERAAMMEALGASFGAVVDAAVRGDFGQRVEAEFPDPELNGLAASVNNLVETVERGLGETGRVLGALAQTDLTHRVEGAYEGAFAQLKTDTNAVAEKLCEIVGQLKDTSRALKTATGEILSGANDLSERTTKQAATIEETSAAMEQLASTVLSNSERARDASGVAASVTRTAEEGGLVMNRATEAMERITQSSGKISNIIGLIDDIAFQTNLLALNASVEAARAGEAGKGFAVVAVEVRRLAQSAAQASSEVKGLIEQSGTEVRTGSKLVAEAASKLEAMLVAARSSNELMGSIARDSQEQAASIEEVNAAVRQMDEMTQHNAALVEETNATIEQTEAQAAELDRIVDIFTIAPPVAAPVQRSRAESAVPGRKPVEPAARPGIKGLQDRVRTAARSYLSKGSVAIDKDWEEF